MATGFGKRVRVEMVKCAVGGSPTAQTASHVGLSTANPGDDGQSNAEPTSTGSYARQSITWETVTAGSNDAAVNALNNGAISWTSTAAFSTGATALTHVSIWNSSSATAEANFIGRAAVAVGQAVNAAGITLTIADNALVMGCNSV